MSDQRLWRIVFHYVEAAVARTDLAHVKRVCIDETAAKRGQDYITLVVDIDGPPASCSSPTGAAPILCFSLPITLKATAVMPAASSRLPST